MAELTNSQIRQRIVGFYRENGFEPPTSEELDFMVQRVAHTAQHAMSFSDADHEDMLDGMFRLIQASIRLSGMMMPLCIFPETTGSVSIASNATKFGQRRSSTLEGKKGKVHELSVPTATDEMD
jgi:hypothetical protein